MICWLALAATAQDNDNNNQKPDGSRLEALKIGYVTKKLNLTPEEAQKFWPVYNQYSSEIRKVRIDAIQNKEEEIVTEEKVLNIRKKYNSEFAKALSPQRVDQFFRCEKEFGAFVTKELMIRRQNRMQQRRPLLRQ
jgi:Spy/CpxP family protein refolding chaperone